MPLAPRTRALVGRTAELDRLRRSGGFAPDVDGGAVLLSGDAGIGKSRLIAELATEATTAGRLVLAGHCVGAGGDTLAWLPFLELISEVETSAPRALEQVLHTHPDLSALRPGSAKRQSPADPGLVGDAVHALLTTVARDRPLLVVVEDVHWADHSSRDLLTLLLTRGFRAPVTFVVSYRSDDLHRRHPLHDVLTVWTRLPLVSRVDLGPLPPPQMHRLVRDLDEAPATTIAVSDVVARAGGNPFFAEELVAGGDSAATPQDLARLLRMRLERLDQPTRDLVHAASLAGHSVDPHLLGEVAGLDADALDEALRQTIEHHILEQTQSGEFRFRHSLLRETVADELLPGARRRLHVAWLEALRSGTVRGSSAELARHAAATGDTETATSSAIEAGDAAMQVGGVRDALRLYEAALGWIDDDPRRRAEVALAAAVAAEASGDQTRSLDLLEEALRDLDPGSHPLLRAQLLGRAAIWYTLLDLPGDPLSLSEEAVALVPEVRDAETLDVMLRHLDVLVACRRSEEASRLADEIITHAEELDLPEVIAETRLHEARLLSTVDPDRARPGLLATAEDPAAPASLRLPALLRLGNLEGNAGDITSAYAHYLLGVEIADRWQRPWGPYGMECRLQAGRSGYELGHWGTAEGLLRSPHDLPHPPRGFMEGALVELQVARGDDVSPDRMAETQRWWEVDVLLVVSTLGGLVDLLGRSERPGELLDVVQRGIATIDRLWSPEAQAIIRLSALFTGQVADLAARGHDVGELRARADEYAARVTVLTGRADVRVGPESRAWVRRLEAERLRLAAALGHGPDGDLLVEAWRDAADRFAAMPNLPEHARSTARLAEALQQVGRRADAREAAAAAKELATRLGARPVLDLLDGLGATETGPAKGAGDLTPRELEVLTHLDRGRTNGQIADLLFISRKTASVHVSNILAKLGAATRGEAVSIARRQGILG